MNLSGKKILITGADGFIGSHVTEELVRQGHSVRAFVLYNSFNSWGWLDSAEEGIKKSLDVFAGDIRDPHGVKTAMKGCDVVLHLAALIAIPYSYHSPDTYVDTNVKGTLNIVQAARELGVDKVVHTSTSEVYGTAKFVPITEDHPLQGQSPYSASKIGADQIAMSFYSSFNTPVSIIRPFNTYGPRQSARAVIPTVITQIAKGLSGKSSSVLSIPRGISTTSPTRCGVSSQPPSPTNPSVKSSTSAAITRYPSETPCVSSATLWAHRSKSRRMRCASVLTKARLNGCGRTMPRRRGFWDGNRCMRARKA